MTYFLNEKIGSNGKYIYMDDEKFQFFSKTYFDLIERRDYPTADYMRENIFRDATETFLNEENVKVLREIQGLQLHHPIVEFVYKKCNYYANLTLGEARIKDKEDWEIYKQLAQYALTSHDFLLWQIVQKCVVYEFRTFEEKAVMKICANIFNLYDMKKLVTPEIYECIKARTKGEIK